MKFKISDDIMRVIVAILAIAAGLSSLFIGASPLTFVLSILMLFFLPGYAITRLFFHERVKMDLFILLSLGLSVLTAMLASAALAIAGILTLDSSVASLVGITLIALMVDKLAHHKNRKFEIELVMPKKEELDPVMTVGIAFGIVLIIIFSVIILTARPPSTTYVALLSENLDLNMPKNATVGEQVNFTIQLKNGEGHAAEFRVEIYANLTKESEHTYNLGNNETRTYSMNVTITSAGYQQIKAEVYIDDVYYRELHFWINVI